MDLASVFAIVLVQMPLSLLLIADLIKKIISSNNKIKGVSLCLVETIPDSV